MNLNLKLWLRKFLKLIRFFDNIIKTLQLVSLESSKRERDKLKTSSREFSICSGGPGHYTITNFF